MTSLAAGVGEALAARDRAGGEVIVLGAGAAEAEVRVVDSDRRGVKVSRVRVRKPAAVPVTREAAALPDRLRALPERLTPLEVDPGHGRGLLRTSVEEMRNREFFEVQIDGGRDLDLRRYRVDEGGERQGIDWTMSREQLGRLLDQLAGGQ